MRDWVSLLAAIGNLSLAVISLSSGRRSPLARPIAALCFVLFGWNFSVLAHHLRLRAGGASEERVHGPRRLLHHALRRSCSRWSSRSSASRAGAEARGASSGRFRQPRARRPAGSPPRPSSSGTTAPRGRCSFSRDTFRLSCGRCCFSGDIYAGAATVARKRGARIVLAALVIGGSFPLSRRRARRGAPAAFSRRAWLADCRRAPHDARCPAPALRFAACPRARPSTCSA